MERFSRIIQVIGEDSFQKLQKAHITIFGLGAVGAWAAEMLARSGIGRFTLVDFDQIAKTNINRHVCAAESTIGILKVEAVRNRILDINPRAGVRALKLFADYTNREEILDENPDIVIDAIDSLGPKASLLEAIHRRGLLAISSMGAALRFDPTAVTTGELMSIKGDALAKAVRARMKKIGLHPYRKVKCVYSTEQPQQCATRGSLMQVTAVFGCTLASMVIGD